MIHAGLDTVPEFQQAIAYGKRDLDAYRNAILQQTEQAKRLYDKEKVRRTILRYISTILGNRGQSYLSIYYRNTTLTRDNKWSITLRKATIKNNKLDKEKSRVLATIVLKTKLSSLNYFLYSKPRY